MVAKKKSKSKKPNPFAKGGDDEKGGFVPFGKKKGKGAKGKK